MYTTIIVHCNYVYHVHVLYMHVSWYRQLEWLVRILRKSSSEETTWVIYMIEQVCWICVVPNLFGKTVISSIFIIWDIKMLHEHVGSLTCNLFLFAESLRLTSAQFDASSRRLNRKLCWQNIKVCTLTMYIYMYIVWVSHVHVQMHM